MPWFKIHYIEELEYEEYIEADNVSHATEQFKDMLEKDYVEPENARLTKYTVIAAEGDNGGYPNDA